MNDPRPSHFLSELALCALALLATSCIEQRSFRPPDEEPPPPPPPTPTTPVLRLPANNSYQGSVRSGALRPSFQWETSQWSGTETVRYTIELSTDAMFSSGGITGETTSTSFQVPSDLQVSRDAPVGNRYFWRVKACAGDACSSFSPVWYVNLGRVERDLNGDGYADVALTARGQAIVSNTSGRLYVYLGGSGDFNTQADTIFNGSGNTWFRNVAGIGDFNGDGFADLAARVTQPNGQMPRVLIYFGGKGSVLDSTPDHTLEVDSCAALGDWNGDHLDDLLLVSYTGTTSILLGTKAQTPAPAEPFAASTNARGAGDVNGDGFADLLSRGLNDDVLLYFGSATQPFEHESDGRLTGAPSAQFGSSMAAAGDVNGDGFADVLVGAPADATKGSLAGRAFAYLGGRGAAFDTMPDGVFEGAANEQLGYAVAGIGDVNGDGFDDFGIRTFVDLQGRMYVYYGKAGSTVDISLRSKLEGEPGKTSLFGASSVGGDVNGDGFDDLWVGAPMYSTQTTYMAGRAYIFLGAAGATLEQLPDASLDQGEGDNASFGHLSMSSTDLTL